MGWIVSTEWFALVRSVPHADDCASHFGLGVSHPHLANYVGRCNCSRDARIARGLEAALLVADTCAAPPGVVSTDQNLASAARAFEEASRL